MPAVSNTDLHPDSSISAQIAASRRDTIPAAIHRSAVRHRDTVALRFEDREWTYQDLNDAASIVSAILLDQGVSRGDRVAVYGKNSDAFMLVFLGALRAGAVHVPINFALTGDELTYALIDSGATHLFADVALMDKVEQVIGDTPISAARVLHSGENALVDEVVEILADPQRRADYVARGQQPDVESHRDDLVQLLYTSGTTSRPKGSMHTHGSLLAHYNSVRLALDVHQDDNPIVCMPLYHSAALHVFMLPYLLSGATVRLTTTPDIPTVLELIEKESVAALFLAPTVWVPLAQHPDLETRDLSTLRKAYYGASIMPTTVLQRLRERYPKIGFYNAFGQSEMGPLCTVLRPEDHDERPASAGRPIDGVELRVVDPEGNPVEIGTPGEVQYRSPQLFRGYWNKPEATAESFQDGWFRSGDQVVMDAEGYIEVVDRIKDVINTGGILVASREIEDAIYRHDAVSEVAVIGRPDDRWIEKVTAFVVLKDGAHLTAEELTTFVREYLAPFKVPKDIEFVAELPRNQSGKILKRELRNL